MLAFKSLFQKSFIYVQKQVDSNNINIFSWEKNNVGISCIGNPCHSPPFEGTGNCCACIPLRCKVVILQIITCFQYWLDKWMQLCLSMLKIKQQKAIVCVWGSFQMKSCIHWILIGSFSPWHVSWCELSTEWTAAVKMAPAKSQGIYRKLRCFRLQHKPFGPSFTLRNAWFFVSAMSINTERCQALWVNLIWVEKRHFAGRVYLSEGGKSFFF